MKHDQRGLRSGPFYKHVHSIAEADIEQKQRMVDVGAKCQARRDHVVVCRQSLETCLPVQ